MATHLSLPLQSLLDEMELVRVFLDHNEILLLPFDVESGKMLAEPWLAQTPTKAKCEVSVIVFFSS